MTVAEETVRAHPIHSIIAQLSAAKNNTAFSESASDHQTAWLTQRIFGFVSVVEERLASLPASLVSIPVLAQLQSPLQSALTEVTNFVSNRNVAHLTNAASQLDGNGYQFLAQLPTMSGKTSGKTLGKIADDYAAHIQQLIATLTEQKSKLEEENTRLGTTLASQATQIQELTALVAQQKGEAQATSAEVKRDYAKAEQELRAQFEKTLTAQEDKYKILLQKWAEDVASKSELTQVTITALIAEITAKRDQAAQIVQIVGNIGVTGNYQKTAVDETRQANLWRFITLAAFAIAISLGTWALWSLHEVLWVTAVVRMLFAFVVLSVTIYTGRESARHRSNADYARRTELELASLGPFIESLPVAKQNELRERLAERYFGNKVEAHEAAFAVTPSSLIDLLKAAMAALARK